MGSKVLGSGFRTDKGVRRQVSGVSVQRRRWSEKRTVKSKKKLMNVEHPPAMHSGLS